MFLTKEMIPCAFCKDLWNAIQLLYCKSNNILYRSQSVREGEGERASERKMQEK